MQFVIGLGSGRCGTASLAKLLDAQPNSAVYHEKGNPLPWRVNPALLRRHLGAVKGTTLDLCGDVAFFYMPYMQLIEEQLQPKYICLQRNRRDTVDSFIEWTEFRSPRRNHWQHHSGGDYTHTIHDQCFPKYDAESKRAALYMYYDEYYDMAQQWAQELPKRFRIFPMDALNTKLGVEAILGFAGVTDPRVLVGLRRNIGPRS